MKFSKWPSRCRSQLPDSLGFLPFGPFREAKPSAGWNQMMGGKALGFQGGSMGTPGMAPCKWLVFWGVLSIYKSFCNHNYSVGNPVFVIQTWKRNPNQFFSWMFGEAVSIFLMSIIWEPSSNWNNQGGAFAVSLQTLTWQRKIHHLKMYFLLKIGIFQCYVSFQGVNRIFTISTGDRRISEPSTEIWL